MFLCGPALEKAISTLSSVSIDEKTIKFDQILANMYSFWNTMQLCNSAGPNLKGKMRDFLPF